MSAMHTDTNSFWAIEDARADEEIMSAETLALLNEICADVDELIPDFDTEVSAVVESFPL